MRVSECDPVRMYARSSMAKGTKAALHGWGSSTGVKFSPDLQGVVKGVDNVMGIIKAAARPREIAIGGQTGKFLNPVVRITW